MTASTRNVLAVISERDWQRAVLEGFALYGWRVWHDSVAEQAASLDALEQAVIRTRRLLGWRR